MWYFQSSFICSTEYFKCRGCFDVCEYDLAVGSPSLKEYLRSDPEQQSQILSPRNAEDQEAGRDNGESPGKSSSLAVSPIPGLKKVLSDSLQYDEVLSPKMFVADGDR